jgi:hypothetical protein
MLNETVKIYSWFRSKIGSQSLKQPDQCVVVFWWYSVCVYCTIPTVLNNRATGRKKGVKLYGVPVGLGLYSRFSYSQKVLFVTIPDIARLFYEIF